MPRGGFGKQALADEQPNLTGGCLFGKIKGTLMQHLWFRKDFQTIHVCENVDRRVYGVVLEGFSPLYCDKLVQQQVSQWFYTEYLTSGEFQPESLTGCQTCMTVIFSSLCFDVYLV